MMFVFSIKLFKGMFLIDYLIFQKPDDLFELMDMCPSGLMDLFTTFITCIVLSSHIVDVLGGWLSIGLANFFHSLLMNTFQHLFSGSIGLLFQDEIIEPASETMDLHVV
jgi:hypothetical protein